MGKIPLLTTEQFQEKVAEENKTEAGFVVRVDGVEREFVDGVPCLVVYHVSRNGEEFGVIMDRQYAEELTSILGQHPLVEEYFRLH